MSKSKLLLFEIILGSLIGLFAISQLTKSKTDLENFALGEETKSFLAKDGDFPVHLIKLDKEGTQSLKKGWKARGEKDVYLILGNSQTHSINQLKTGDKTYVQELHDNFSDTLDFLSLTFPNANLQELYLGAEYIKSEYPVKAIILPVFMDDLREDGIRSRGFEYLAERSFRLGDTSSAILQRIDLSLANLSIGESTEEKKDALYETVQAKSEKILDDNMSEKFPLWAERPTMRGEFFLSLYKLRNRVFGINAQTKRKMIPTRYADNFAVLEEFLQATQEEGIKVLLYIPPIRQDVEVPYNLAEYAKFKGECEVLAAKYNNVNFANLESTVPAKYWGVKNSTNGSGKPELDFMHFQNEGHERLYDALLPEIQRLIK